jgi:hypothetical protein
MNSSVQWIFPFLPTQAVRLTRISHSNRFTATSMVARGTGGTSWKYFLQRLKKVTRSAPWRLNSHNDWPVAVCCLPQSTCFIQSSKRRFRNRTVRTRCIIGGPCLSAHNMSSWCYWNSIPNGPQWQHNTGAGWIRIPCDVHTSLSCSRGHPVGGPICRLQLDKSHAALKSVCASVPWPHNK